MVRHCVIKFLNAVILPIPVALGQCDILQYFLEHLKRKRDVNVTDNIHATPAHDAAEYGQMESMLLLLRHGADLTIKDTASHCVGTRVLRRIQQI